MGVIKKDVIISLRIKTKETINSILFCCENKKMMTLTESTTLSRIYTENEMVVVGGDDERKALTDEFAMFISFQEEFHFLLLLSVSPS